MAEVPRDAARVLSRGVSSGTTFSSAAAGAATASAAVVSFQSSMNAIECAGMVKVTRWSPVDTSRSRTKSDFFARCGYALMSSCESSTAWCLATVKPGRRMDAGTSFSHDPFTSIR